MSDITINVCPLDLGPASKDNRGKLRFKPKKKGRFAVKDRGLKKKKSSVELNGAIATASHGFQQTSSTTGDPGKCPDPKLSSLEINVASTSASAPPAAPTKYLALDCEMVGAGPKGSINQLARCSIVSYDGDVVYDKFIRPAMPVTDYRTRWSGIRQRDLVKATPYAAARKEILKLLWGKVVVGHAVHNDFKVLGYGHPAAQTRDTSRIPLLNKKAGFAEKECVSLKRLTKALLDRDIQTGRKGHSSVEDAKATMELYRIIEVEWERQLASKVKPKESR